jgi:NTE family protein
MIRWNPSSSTMLRLCRTAALVTSVAAVGLVGCATAIFNPPTNVALSVDAAPNMGAPIDVMGENSIFLSFSGGGLRAAAFAHGVLTGLRSVRTGDGDLLDDVAIVSSVSGSSLTAAYYGVHGRDGLGRFRSEVLLPGFESGLRLSLFRPGNVMRMIGGGLNAREDFGEALDRRAFHGATFADMYRHGRPEIRIHATDLYHRIPFPFLPPLFRILCSDLSRYSVADAVAASMAVPLVFAPVVIRTYPEACDSAPPELALFEEKRTTSRLVHSIARAMSAYRDPDRVRYIKLADGGLTDNLGVSTFTLSRAIYGTPYAPMTRRDAVKIRRLLLIVVDASQGPNGDWTLHAAGPSGFELARSATDAAVDVATDHAADAFQHMIAEWQQSVIAFRCGLSSAEVAELGGPANWECADVKVFLDYVSVENLPPPLRQAVESVPTRLTLSPEQVDVAIQGGREGMLALPRLREYLQARLQASPP